MQKGKVNNNNLFIVVAIIFILLCLSLINIDHVTSNKSVLGVSQVEKDDSDFWKEFLDSNPNYIPGLIETGNTDKVKEINQNFEGV